MPSFDKVMSNSSIESATVLWGTYSRRAQDLLLQNVLTDALLLLFTPASPSPSRTRPGQADHDPFEVLGRSLADHFPRVRHVPYSIHDGMTEAHVEFIRAATINIVVVAEVSHSCSNVNGEVHGLIDGRRSLSTQMQFANVVRSIARGSVSDPPRPAPPAILITIGRSLMTTWRSRVTALQDWQLVLNVASNDPIAIHKAVEVLVGEGHADGVNGEVLGRHALVVEGMNNLHLQHGTSGP